MNTTRQYTQSSRAETTAATRERIARTAMAMFFEHAYDDVTIVAIAKAAGVSHQTVLNHFDSKEGVARAAAEIISAETKAARDIAAPGDTEGAIRAIVGEYERFGDANFRWAATTELESLGPILDQARASHMDYLTRQFGDRLPAAPAARKRVLTALYAATDVYIWKLLRRDLKRSRRDTEHTMADLVTAVLERGTNR